MTKLNIKLNLIDEIKEFVKLASSFDIVNVYKGSYVVDGSSILGVLSIDTTEGVTVELVSDNESDIERFKYVMKKFEV